MGGVIAGSSLFKTRGVVGRSLSFFLSSFLAAACAPPVDSTAASAPAPLSANTARRADDVLSAVTNRDWRAIQTALAANHASPGVVLKVEQGPLDGYQGSVEPVVVRHASAPDVVLLIAADTNVAVAVLGVDGRLTPLTPEVEAVDGLAELRRLRIRQSALTSQGVLLVGPAGVDLRALDAQTLALAIVDDRWDCAASQSSCAAADYACVFEQQQRCLEEDLTFLSRYPLEESANEVERLEDYLRTYGSIANVTVSDAPVVTDDSGTWHALSFRAPVGAQLARVMAHSEDDDAVELQWRQVDGALQVRAPDGGFKPGVVIVDTSAAQARFDSIGVTKAPASAAAAKACRTWSLSGCVRVEDTVTSTSTAHRAVANARLRGASASVLGLGIFLPWSPTVTDANGCFSTTKTFCGLGAKSKRKLRAKLAFHDSKVKIHNPFAPEVVLDQGFFRIYQGGSYNSDGSYGAGTLLFKPGNSGELGETKRVRQALSWYVTHALDAAFTAQDPWFKYPGFYFIEYPHPLFEGIAFPVVPPVVAIKDSEWDVPTLVHEVGHVWHYMHNSGAMPNLVTSLLNGLSTHNCQEDNNIAFLEGFAEFFSRQALCGAVFASPQCYAIPRSRTGLLTQDECNDEEGHGLLSPGMVRLNDDGVTHALELLVVDNLYWRDFHGSADWWLDYVVPVPNLSTACQWYPFNNLNFWHVLKTFRANTSLGFPDNFSSNPAYGIVDFYARFRTVQNLPVGFIQDRLRLWDVNWTQNPADVCRKPCNELSNWWSGGPQASTLVANVRCDIQPVPGGQTAFVENNHYFVKQPITCPLGSWDTANCHVLTPAPGTTAFIWAGNLYTSALPGNVCPHGGFDGANCFIATPPAGTTGFVWNGMLYTTPLKGPCTAGILVSSDHCYIGTPPAGATAQINAGHFSYPRQ